MKSLAIALSDLYGPHNLENNLFVKLLGERFAVKVTSDFSKADLLIYSDFGTTHRGFKGRKIYVTGENMLPDYNEHDFAITSSLRPNDLRHYRIPYYVFQLPNPEPLIRSPEFSAEEALRAKTGFCCFVASNPRALERNRFFKILNRQRKVDSGGRHFNNIGGPVANKAEFLAKYRFIIAFENTTSSGYTTEKLVDAMLAGGVPIYWGNPEVGQEFNTRSFINAADFLSLDALADHVLRVGSDDELYLSYLREPWFVGNRVPDVFRMDLLRDALVNFIESGIEPGPRIWRRRRLREHVYASPLQQTTVSLRCRLEGWFWKCGIRF